MNDDVVIRVENLGKKYRIKHQAERQRYTALRDVLADKIKGILQKQKVESGKQKSVEDFWALKDVNFEVKQGEVVGIIGRNGAGKSTLLKILSRITEPTEGRVRIKGRVASLLEVGTGFHPELTGRENIFLNGAILGMRRDEIKRKFDEIVAFAEVEKFLDTPVKRYSSGMYVRLAFAVAAHLEPEILIVDEVLAVGDAEFQKKCLGKMQEVSRCGRTVLFVSHNMDAVIRLCGRAILLQGGNVAGAGVAQAIVSMYLRAGGDACKIRWDESSERPGNDVVKLIELLIHDDNGCEASAFGVSQKIGLSMTYEVVRDDVALVDNFNIFNDQGLLLFVTHNVTSPLYNKPRKLGFYKSTAWIPENLLPEGSFTVSAAMVSIAPFHIHLHEEQVLTFHILDESDGRTARGQFGGVFPGAIRPLIAWETGRFPVLAKLRDPGNDAALAAAPQERT